MKWLLGWFSPVHQMEARIAGLQIENAGLKSQLRNTENAVDELLKGNRAADKALAEERRARSMRIQDLEAEIAALRKSHKEELAEEEMRLRLQMNFPRNTDPCGNIMEGQDAQASRTMARQIKAKFVAYQEAVGIILKRLDKLKGKNRITANDMAELDLIRRELRGQLGREL